ncbi:uncharacterized protein LOC122622391 [Drosophila teissieri]|uniref:uncharacterized protein LOC122622391 n=1 Tax=Drosophila teissieri TaxID=7243 RepID=UPI001CBA0AAC|nr:uncharacterized protein LOC122622391 [Drosophila teissieri]XP_043656737.1 uncharacterized protein LOC122622391 [Drosophila teissieri]
MVAVTVKRTQAVGPTFEVTQLSCFKLSTNRGVQLPPLMMKGQIRPNQVENARFRVVLADRRPLRHQQFNALIRRLVKCFMSEVEITKRLRKVTSKRPANPGELQLIRHLEALRRHYETERSVLVVKLSLDSRFNLCAPYAANLGDAQPSKSKKSRKSNPLETPSKNNNTIQKPTSRKNEHDIRTRQRQSGGSLPNVCNHTVTPGNLTSRLMEKLYRLEETFKSYFKRPQFKEPSPANQNLLVSVKNNLSASSDVFYDFPDIVVF